MNKKNFIIISLCILAIISFLSIYNYNILPNNIASHWNAQGNPDGYSTKFNALIIMPICFLSILAMSIFIPIVAPNKESIKKFSSEYYNFILIILAFLSLIQLYTIYINLGLNISIISLFSLMFFIIFFYSGKLMNKSKQNYFIGIRTPWTLKNKKVWNKTHKIGATLFKISGFLCLFGLIYENLFIWIVIGPVILSSIFLYIYSYIIYNKIEKDVK